MNNITELRGQPAKLLPLNAYDKVIVHVSAGKDSVASLLLLKDLEVDFSKLEIWHQAVDGYGEDHEPFWDWPCTESYLEALGEILQVPVYYQWKRGGLKAELLRKDSLTGDVLYAEDGRVVSLPTMKGKRSTRWKFPAQSGDLRIRWCSTFKVDAAKRALNNNPRLVGTLDRPMKILWITGERREEGGNRCNYLEAEVHASSGRKRLVHHWRPVIDWTQAQIFELFRKHRIMPHPAYYLGFGRVSCMGCIFSTSHQWAALQYIDRSRVEQFAAMEQYIGHTIDVKMTVLQKAAAGTLEKVLPLTDPMLHNWIRLALSTSLTANDLRMDNFVMPAGAFKGCEGGPK